MTTKSGAGSGYEINSFTFSPDGHLFQVEYAVKAVEKEPVAIGVRCSDGVLLAVEKPLPSPLLTRNANPQIYWIDTHIACATCGYRPDCHAAVVRAREEAAQYFNVYSEPIPVPELVARLAFHFHSAHGFAAIRPYGCTLIFGSFQDSAVLYALEPSGQYFGYFATVFGKDNVLARQELKRTEWGSLTVADAVPRVAKLIAGLPQSQNKKWEIEMVAVTRQSGGRPEAVPQELIAAALTK
jgi:20S proteasome subunit alpha 7